MEINKTFKKEHKVFLTNKNNLFISAIEKVISISDSTIVVDAYGCCLNIFGKNIEVTKLNVDAGELEATGDFIGIKYSIIKEKIGLVKRIFK